MRRAGVSLPPEAIWLGGSWEEPPARRRTAVAADELEPTPRPTATPRAATSARPATPAREPVAADRTIADPPERRTVVIRGRGAERDLTWTAHQNRRRPTRPRHQRPGFKPDRAALWAVLLGLLLVLVAATSSHAALRTHFTHSSPPAARPALPPGRPPAAARLRAIAGGPHRGPLMQTRSRTDRVFIRARIRGTGVVSRTGRRPVAQLDLVRTVYAIYTYQG
jgi:hypothetical protein